MGAGAAIEDDQRAVVAPHLNTRRVAAVAQRDSTRLGQGSAGTPKPDIHPCTLARHRGAAPRTVGTTPLPVEDKAYQRAALCVTAKLARRCRSGSFATEARKARGPYTSASPQKRTNAQTPR